MACLYFMYIHCNDLGFSYGGSLACAAFAGMLQGNFSNQESLASNVCCITFGQPLECSPALEDEIRQREKLKCCFNRIYLEAEYARHANRLLSRLGYDIDQLQDVSSTVIDLNTSMYSIQCELMFSVFESVICTKGKAHK